jgi:hypothetical protein
MTRTPPWPYAGYGSPSWLRPDGHDPALDAARDVALAVDVPPRSERGDVLLAAAARTRDVAERLDWVLLSLVGEARAEGLSWEQVAAALGVSKQAAHKRYAPHLADAYARAGAPAEQQPA